MTKYFFVSNLINAFNYIWWHVCNTPWPHTASSPEKWGLALYSVMFVILEDIEWLEPVAAVNIVDGTFPPVNRLNYDTTQTFPPVNRQYYGTTHTFTHTDRQDKKRTQTFQPFYRQDFNTTQIFSHLGRSII